MVLKVHLHNLILQKPLTQLLVQKAELNKGVHNSVGVLRGFQIILIIFISMKFFSSLNI